MFPINVRNAPPTKSHINAILEKGKNYWKLSNAENVKKKSPFLGGVLISYPNFTAISGNIYVQIYLQ